jgi:site-specific DNA recombinase
MSYLGTISLKGVFLLRAVIYSRISREDQSNYSLNAQIEDCKAYIERNAHELIEIYIDDGESAKDLLRPRIQDLMNDLKKNKFDLVICWKLDRLTRDTVDGLTLIINLFKKKHNVIFASVTEDIKTETSDDVMMLTIRLSLAQAEREKIRERVTMGQMARAKTGKRNTSAKPYGYNVGEDLSLTIQEEEAEVVREIFGWYVSGHGRNKIATLLNDRHIPSPRGSIWFELIVGNVIKNPVYKGATHWKRKADTEDKRIIVEGMHEPIISEELWNLAQKIRQRRADNDMNQSNYDFPFSTIIKCGECGRSYHGKQLTKVKWGNKTRHYRCAGKYRQDSCSSSDISEIKLTKLFLDFLQKFEFKSEDMAKPLDGIDVAKEKKKLEKQIADSKTRRNNYVRAMADNKLKYEDFIMFADEEDTKTKVWQEELNQLLKHIPSTQKTRSDTMKALSYLHQQWDEMTVIERKINIQRMFHFLVIRKRDGVWGIVAYKLCD